MNPVGPCEFYTAPFLYLAEKDARCGKPGKLETFRRKSLGDRSVTYRCEEHSGRSNDDWELDEP